MPSALFGIPFVLIGLYLMVGRFLADAWLRSRMVYALTNRRVLFLRHAPWPSFKALSLSRLPDVMLDEGSNGRGTIRFGTPALVSDGDGGKHFATSWTEALDPDPKVSCHRRRQEGVHGGSAGRAERMNQIAINVFNRNHGRFLKHRLAAAVGHDPL